MGLSWLPGQLSSAGEQHGATSSRGSTLSACLGHTERRVVLGHTLNTQTLRKTDGQKNGLSAFTILGGATFRTILGHMRPCRLDTPEI